MINDHTGLLGSRSVGGCSTPVVHTVHGPLDGEPGDALRADRRGSRRRSALISISTNQRRAEARPALGRELPERARPLALPVQAAPRRLPALPRADEPDKGAHRAIAVAIERGPAAQDRGQVPRAARAAVLRRVRRPHLADRIEYVGEVTHGEKVELLQHARATLFPIEWEEPFGLVMIESMACGTPVIATRFGARARGDRRRAHRRHRRRLAGDGRRARTGGCDRPAGQRRAVEERFSPERMVARLRRGVREDDRTVGRTLSDGLMTR